MDYADSFAQLRDVLDGLTATDKTIEEIDAIRQFREVVDERHRGTVSDVLKRMEESFGENETTIPVQKGWQVEVGLLPDSTSANNYLVVFWRVTKPEGGSLNLPYIIQKRSINEFEIAMPA